MYVNFIKYDLKYKLKKNLNSKYVKKHPTKNWWNIKFQDAVKNFKNKCV